MDSKEIVAYIEMNFDVTYSVSGVTALLHSMGFTYKKARPVPGKAKKKHKNYSSRRTIASNIRVERYILQTQLIPTTTPSLAMAGLKYQWCC